MELSAIIFASAIGIKLGVLTYDWIVSWFVKERRAGAKARFGEMLRDLPLIIGTIVVMLFLAAIIESTVTPLLIQNFMGQEMSVVKDMFK